MNKRYWLSGGAILALAMGSALAQTTIETTRQTTTTVAPVTVVPPAVTVAPTVSGYSQTKTERSTDGFGTQTESTQSYNANSSGTSSRSETQVKRPDGTTESAYREQWSTSGAAVPLPPVSGSTTTTVVPAVPIYPPVGTTTTTTTIRR